MKFPNSNAPVHAALVHFPIALFFAVVLLDIAGWNVDNGAEWYDAAWLICLAGVVMAIPAAATGVIDLLQWRSADDPRTGRAYLHLALADASIALMATSLVLRWVDLDRTEPDAVAFGFAVAAAVVVGMASGVGGEMAWRNRGEQQGS